MNIKKKEVVSSIVKEQTLETFQNVLSEVDINVANMNIFHIESQDVKYKCLAQQRSVFFAR